MKILVNPERIDMLDIIDMGGKQALVIDGAVIGTEEAIISHLNKSVAYDELKNYFSQDGGVTNE